MNADLDDEITGLRSQVRLLRDVSSRIFQFRFDGFLFHGFFIFKRDQFEIPLDV